MAEDNGARKPDSDAEARARLAAIVDSSDDAIISKSLDGTILTWNRGAERLYGYSAQEAVGRDISILMPTDRYEEYQRLREIMKRGERLEHLETVRLRKDGTLVDISLTLSPILAADGAVTGISAVARDITERKRMEQSLRESEKRYRTLVEMAADAVVVHQEGRFVYTNCAALGIFGARSLEELQRVSLLDLVHPEERDALRARIQQLLEGEEIPLREYRLRRLNGEEISVEASSTLIDYQGRPSIQVIAREITERKRAEQEREIMLRQLDYERSRFEAVVRQLPIGVMIAEAPSGRLIYDNEQSRRIFRQEFQEAQSFADYGKFWKICRPDGSPLPAEEYPLARAVLGETVTGEEYRIGRGDGSQGYVCVNAIPILNPSGEIVSGLAAFHDITESKAAAEALFDSEERLNLALEAAEMGSCDMEVPSGKGLWSRRHFQLLGYRAPKESSAPATIAMWQELIHPEDKERVAQELESARRELRLFRSEHRVIRADTGEPMWVNVQGRFICDSAGAVCRFIGVIYDVSERKAAEEAIRQSEQRFRLMTDSMPQIAWTAETDGSADYINAHFETYTGIDRDSGEVRDNLRHPERLILMVVHPDDAQRVAQSYQKAVGSGEIFQEESRVRRFDGSYRWHLSRAIPARDREGRVVKWYGTSTDIHDLREMQEALRASESKFRRLYESNLVAIYFWDQDGRVIEANQAYCDLVGYSADQCRSEQMSWLEATPPEFQPRDYAAMQEVRERGCCRPYEKELINSRNGQRVSVLAAVAMMEGSEAEGIAFAVDLTELKRAEQALKTSEETLKLAVETTGLGIFDMDLRSGKGVWSDIAKRHYGLHPEAEPDLDMLMAGVHPEDRERLRQIARDAADPRGSGEYSAEYRTIGLNDGKLRWLTMRARHFFNGTGAPVRLVGACLDITDIVHAEKALKDEIMERLRAVEALAKQEQLLIRQGRLAAMGEMIGNIAHQWRQPLNTLALLIQELPRYYERDLFSKEYLESNVSRAMQVINYMSKTIDGFRNFIGPDKEKEEFRVAEVLARTISIVEAAFSQLNLRIEVSADEGIVIYGCPNEFSQVILNILVNAKDALVERRVQEPRVTVRLYQEEGKMVLTIADNAGGIPLEIMDKIFDPYFTTKGSDKGTGIGLFMSKTIIEKNMNGTLMARNTEEGAEFRIEV
jgi:PAS domain S-box-containing protein